MKSGRVGDRLDVVFRRQVFVVSGYCRKAPFGEVRNGLLERVTQVRVLRGAAVAGPPARVDGEFHEIRQAPDLLRAAHFAAPQRAKRVQVDGFGPSGFEVRVQEREVRELVLGVVVDVLRHVFIEHFKRFDVRGAAATAWDLAVLDAAELVVLLPEVGLEDLRGGEEPEDRCVALAQLARRRLLRQRGRRGLEGGETGSHPDRNPARHQRAATDAVLRLIRWSRGRPCCIHA